LLRKAGFVIFIGVIVLATSVQALRSEIPIGPVVLGLGLLPLLGLMLGRRSLKSAIPDLVFGAIDTGLLAIPAVLGGLRWGVVGAVAGGVVGDAVTDSIAGFFEGGIAEWLRRHGIDESRDALTTSLGKMAGCLLGAGLVLTAALALGLNLGGRGL